MRPAQLELGTITTTQLVCKLPLDHLMGHCIEGHWPIQQFCDASDFPHIDARPKSRPKLV
ncbi:MAG: hypothetical protein DHS20C16_26300 [Phycisphaerae bacterium]|nr:MAG: hypothetical protein DHS20C16_26300 [Phycisphaerae bacterium]